MVEVRAYAARLGIKPSTVIQNSGAGGGGTWKRWEEGDGSPTLHTVDKIRRFIVDNPPPAVTADAA